MVYVNGTLTIGQATLTVTAANASRAYGAANPAFTATAVGAVNGDTFTLTASSAATTSSPVGTYPIMPLATGSNLASYTVVYVDGTLTVGKATPVVTWANPATIAYGTAISSTQLDASSTTPGSFVYTPAAGAILPVGTDTLSVTFTPTDTASYTAVTQTATITVGQATLTVTAASASRAYGAANPAFTATAAGAVNGDTFTLTASSTATTSSPVGTYPITPLATGSQPGQLHRGLRRRHPHRRQGHPGRDLGQPGHDRLRHRLVLDAARRFTATSRAASSTPRRRARSCRSAPTPSR